MIQVAFTTFREQLVSEEARLKANETKAEEREAQVAFVSRSRSRSPRRDEDESRVLRTFAGLVGSIGTHERARKQTSARVASVRFFTRPSLSR